MSASLLMDALIVLLLVGLAGWTVMVRDGFASIAGFVAFGVMLMLAWFRLRSPDVALTEGAIATGLSGIVLFSAQARVDRRARMNGSARMDEDLRASNAPRDSAAMDPDHPGVAVRAAVALLSVVVTIMLALVVIHAVEPAPSLSAKAAADLPALGLGNAVNGVLLGFRALDTLLEKVVVFLATVGIWSLAHDRAWLRAPVIAAEPRHGAITLLARVLTPFGVIFAFYLLWNGADHPGGAFAAAAVLAAMWLLTAMAGLTRLPSIASHRLRVAIVVGPVAFIAVAFLGIVVAGAFLAYPEAWAKALIIVVEIPLTISVAVMLTLLVAGPPAESSAPC